MIDSLWIPNMTIIHSFALLIEFELQIRKKLKFKQKRPKNDKIYILENFLTMPFKIWKKFSKL